MKDSPVKDADSAIAMEDQDNEDLAEERGWHRKQESLHEADGKT